MPVARIRPTPAVGNIVGGDPIVQLYIPGLANDAGRQALAIEKPGAAAAA